KLDAKITALDTKITDILKWTAGIFAAQTALIIGAMFAIQKLNQHPAQEMRMMTPQVQEMRVPAPSTVPQQSKQTPANTN
ncbi:MAG: hypothetical protein H7839_22885, partial [Magnetococcus sp. YQC-5]